MTSQNVLIAVDSEAALLSAIVYRQSILDSLQEVVTADDFGDSINRRAFEILNEMHHAGVYLQDLGALTKRLRDDQYLRSNTEFNATGYLGRIAIAGIPENSPQYIAEILDASNRRKLFALVQKAENRIFNPSFTPMELAEWLECESSLVGKCNQSTDTAMIEQAGIEALREIRAAAKSGKLLGIPTGLYDLDGIFGGWHRSELSFVAGGPGGGKTSFVMQGGRYAAERGYVVLIASLEMSRRELATRELCGAAQVSAQDVRTGNLTDEDIARLEASLSELKGIPLHIYDPPSASLTKIRAEAKRIKATHGLDLLIVDYLSLIVACRETRSLNNRELVGNSARRLKQLAKELDIPIVCLSQVNRAGLQSETLALHNLAETAEVERNADNVIFLNRDDRSPEVVVAIAKHRHGPKGQIKVDFDESRTRFVASSSEWKP